MTEKEYMKRVAEIDIDHRGPLPPYDDPTTLTRRDRFAMAALTGFLAFPECEGSYEYIAEQVYRIADAMEAARNKEGAE